MQPALNHLPAGQPNFFCNINTPNCPFVPQLYPSLARTHPTLSLMAQLAPELTELSRAATDVRMPCFPLPRTSSSPVPPLQSLSSSSNRLDLTTDQARVDAYPHSWVDEDFGACSLCTADVQFALGTQASSSISRIWSISLKLSPIFVHKCCIHVQRISGLLVGFNICYIYWE